MSGGSVSFTLDDGEKLRVPDADLQRVYDMLWDLAKEPGAVSTAALLKDTWQQQPFARSPISLTTPQSAVLRKAIAQLPA